MSDILDAQNREVDFGHVVSAMHLRLGLSFFPNKLDNPLITQHAYHVTDDDLLTR
jgi:hypothetical protein